MSAPCPHECYAPGDCDGSCTHPEPEYGALEHRILQYYFGENTMESLEDIAARALHVDMPTGRLVWNDKLRSTNDKYKAFYQRQNFDLRFGHLFPVYQPKHTLRNTTALRVVSF